jgi:hypothetical protein
VGGDRRNDVAPFVALTPGGTILATSTDALSASPCELGSDRQNAIGKTVENIRLRGSIEL